MGDPAQSRATGPNTPPRGGGDAAPAPELKSTPIAVGTASVSEHMSTLGTRIKNVSPFVSRDVENHKTCGIDDMFGELLHRCRNTRETDPGKAKLLEDAFKSVLPVCNRGKPAQEIKKLLTSFSRASDEKDSYQYFVGAANTALLELSKVNAPGILPSKDSNDGSDILFHHNDKEMYQMHQGVQSTRKPDVVVVPWEAAQDVQEEGNLSHKSDVYGVARQKPAKGTNFQWKDVRSTVEFKRSGREIALPPAQYKLTSYTPPEVEAKHMECRRDMDASPQLTNPAPAPATTSAQKELSQPLRKSARLKNSSQGGTKRASDNLGSNEPSSKRLKTHQRNDEDEPEKLHPAVQNGLYVAEIFASHTARQHVISCVVMNDIIYLWRFDRQDAIQCAGFNFIQDLPRFMVLLLIMQRMRNVQWGLNPLFADAPGSFTKIHVKDTQLGIVDLEFDLKAEDRTTHYGLRGRATNVFPVKSTRLSELLQTPEYASQNICNDMVAKLYWPEESRESEPEILKKVKKIAENHPEEVGGHIPEMIWFHKFDETSTANIRKALVLDNPDRGSRVFYIIVFRKLVPITTLYGKQFLRAWWDVVICHRMLWKGGVRHLDVSPSNHMVYQTASGAWIGVLNDFDLSSTRKDGPSGDERTGTIPFMAIELLEEDGIKGKVEHLYRHDAESFIWVLIWICLRYENGKLRDDRPLDAWLKVDAYGCREKKSDFMSSGRRYAQPSSSHELNWRVALACLKHVSYLYIMEDSIPTLEDERVFQTWLQAEVAPLLRE